MSAACVMSRDVSVAPGDGLPGVGASVPRGARSADGWRRGREVGKDAECGDMVKKDEMMKKDEMSKKEEPMKK